MDAIQNQDGFDEVRILFERYMVREKVAGEIEEIYRSIQNILCRIGQSGRAEWAECFSTFAEELQNRYRTILYPGHGRGN